MPQSSRGLKTESESRRENENRFRWIAVALLLLLTAILAFVTVKVALESTPNKSTVALLQVVTLLLGIGTSIYAGRRSALKSAQELLRPHAKSAYRRTLSLSILNARFTRKLDEYEKRLNNLADPDSHQVRLEDVHFSIDLFRVMADDIGTTIADALWDWKDILPEELEELEQLAKDSQPSTPESGE